MAHCLLPLAQTILRNGRHPTAALEAEASRATGSTQPGHYLQRKTAPPFWVCVFMWTAMPKTGSGLGFAPQGVPQPKAMVAFEGRPA